MALKFCRPVKQHWRVSLDKATLRAIIRSNPMLVSLLDDPCTPSGNLSHFILVAGG